MARLSNSLACWTNPHGACPLCFWSPCAARGSGCQPRCLVPTLWRCAGPAFGPRQHVCGRWRAQPELQQLARSCVRLGWEGQAPTRKGTSWASAAAGSPDDASSARRRPADLYLPSFHGRPTTFNFAVTAPQRLDVLVEAGRGGGSAASAYADVKRRYLDTTKVCEQHGVAFVPLVVETSGAWAPEASKILHQLSRAVTLRHGGFGPPLGGPALLEEASVLVRSWRTRATLRRRAELEASWLPVLRSGLFFLTSPAECSFPFIWRASSSKLGFFPSLVGRLLDLSPSVVRFGFLALYCFVFPLCGLRSLLASHPPWPQGAYRNTGQSKIVSFSDPIYTFFGEPYLCAALGSRILAGFFPLQRRFFLQGNRPDLLIIFEEIYISQKI